MLHETWSATDKYFCHFGPFFSLTTWRIKILKKWNKHIHVYHKWRSFLRCKMQPTVFFVILDHFLLSYLPNNLKNQNFEEMKKPPVKMSLFHKYVPKITVIWCMLHKIWSATDKYFCHFGHFFDLTPWKIKIFKKWKKHMCTIYEDGSWDVRCNQHYVLSLWTIFCPFTSLISQKIKILKKWNTWRYYQFTHVYHKWWSNDVSWFLRGSKVPS